MFPGRRVGRPIRRVASLLAAAALLGAPLSVAAASALPGRIPDQSVYDLASAFSSTTEQTAENIIGVIRQASNSDIVVLAEPAASGATSATATSRAAAARAALDVGATSRGDGLLVYLGIAPSRCQAQVVLSPAPGFSAAVLDQLAAKQVVDGEMQPLIAACDLDHALLVGLGRIATAMTALGPGSGANPDGSAAGPPFPDPIDGVRVYDHAGVFRPATIGSVAETIDGIERRTGAQVVVYSQIVGSGRTTEEANGDAQSLMDQWGVGRKGFDDGLVILFDLYPGLEHGQVILYGGPGYRAAFLDNQEKQQLFDDEMAPKLRAGDFDGALLAAIARVDANATPEHAAKLDQARQLNAIVGLVGAPALALVLAGSALWSWLRYGRDPVYLDDPSIHMAGPPADLTPAGGAFVLDGGPSKRALTTALLDLASRGLIAFREESHLLGIRKTVGIDTAPAEPDPQTLARQRRNAARTLGRAERLAETKLDALADDDGYLEAKRLPEFAPSVAPFNAALEREVVAYGWFREPPSKAVARWRVRAGVAFAAGIAGVVVGVNLPSSGLLLLGVGALVGAAVMFVVAGSMPAVSLAGAMIRAMLAAYRRTLKKTMDQARSMDQVVDEAGLTWLETPDQAVVWGMALGLQHEVEQVIGRSLDDQRSGATAPGSTWLPAWYGSSSGVTGASMGDFAGASPGSGGLFSSGGMPDFGGMMSALGTVGSSASHSASSGSSGGFGGGGSGGGGGGSGGGF
jgi:uncharacterized membrane protein YgcG